MPFRHSRFINFNTGRVKLAPMELIAKLGPRAGQPIEIMLEVFECRVDVWQLGPAAAILKLMDGKQAAKNDYLIWRHSGYALLAVTVSYFEMIGKILNPRSSDRRGADDFNAGFGDVYPAFATPKTGGRDKSIAEEFRDRLRNGIYHLGYTKSHLYIHHQPHKFPQDLAVEVKDGERYYFVNPHTMTRTIIAHFPSLMTRLRDSAQESEALRRNFKRFYVDFHQGQS